MTRDQDVIRRTVEHPRPKTQYHFGALPSWH